MVPWSSTRFLCLFHFLPPLSLSSILFSCPLFACYWYTKLLLSSFREGLWSLLPVHGVSHCVQQKGACASSDPCLTIKDKLLHPKVSIMGRFHCIRVPGFGSSHTTTAHGLLFLLTVPKTYFSVFRLHHSSYCGH